MKTIFKLTLLLAAAGLSTTGQAAWQRLPVETNRPVEVAVGALQGTRIESSNRIGQVGALLSDTVSEAATLPTGKSDAVIVFGSQALIERVAFFNSGGEGKFAISASPDNSRWTPLGQMLFSPADSHVVLPFAGIQCKYVKVEFELARGSTMRHFEVYGRVYAAKDAMHGSVTNMTTSLAQARVIYVDPTPASGTDEAARFGNFAFPDSEDKYRTVIYDLGRPKVLNEFGSVHSPRPVRFEVFAFSELPEKEDWRGRRSFDPAVFDTTSPVASFEDKEGKGYLKVKPIGTVTARYVALRWEPDFNPPAFAVAGVDIISTPQQVTSTDGGFAGTGDTGTNDNYAGPFAPNSVGGDGAGGVSATAGGGFGGVDIPPASRP